MGIPATVQKVSKEAYRATGIIPTTTHNDNRWSVLVANSRVSASAVYAQAKGVWVWDSGELTVDGVKCRLSNSWEELAKIFKDPDTHLKDKSLSEDEMNKPGFDLTAVQSRFTDTSEDDAPLRVKKSYELITKELTDKTVRLGRTVDAWAILIYADDNSEAVRIEFADDVRHDIRVIIYANGTVNEMTAESLEEIMRILAKPDKTPDKKPVIGSFARARKVNSVDIRQGTVRRV